MLILIIILALCDILLASTNYILHYVDPGQEFPAIIEELDLLKPEVITPPEKIRKPEKRVKRKEVVKEEKITEEKAEYLSAKELLDKGLYQESIGLFNRYLTKYPGGGFRIRAIISLGDIYFILKNYPESVRYYSQVLDEKANNNEKAEAMFKLARTYLQNNELDKSISTAVRVAKLYPDTIHAIDSLIFLGNTYRKKGEPQKGIMEYQKVVVKYKNSEKVDEAWFLLGDAYENEPAVRDLKKAVECYKKIINYYPESLYFSEAKERVQFLNKHFFDIK